MDIESQQPANTQARKFERMVVHRRIAIRREFAKVIRINYRLIEILTSIQTCNGAQLVIYIRNNDSNDENLGSNIVINP